MKDVLFMNPARQTIPIIYSIKTRPWIVAGALFVLGLASRLPFQSQILYHWDSVNFAFALTEFNLAKEQPHPPGYIGYVWLGRLVDTLFHNAQTSLVGISIVSSALAVVALFYLGQSMFNRRTGLIAALLLTTSPLFWFYGEIALPHTLDTLLVIVSMWWLYQTMQGNRQYLYPAITAMAVAGGIRPQTLVFLIPVLLFALRGVGWRRFLTAGLLGALICLGWFLPLITLSGGLDNYLRITGEFGSRFQESTSIFMGAGWWGLRRNLIKLILYTLYGWSLAIIPAAIYFTACIRRREWPRQKETFLFLSIWVAPALLFYIFVHMGQQGLVFIFLPALLLLSAAGLSRLLAAQPRLLITAAMVFTIFNAGIFCLLPEYPLGPNTQRFLTRDTLRNSDTYFQTRFEAIKTHFDPHSTAILATQWHHVEYYLPEYTVIPFNFGSKWEKDEGLLKRSLKNNLILTAKELGLQLNNHSQTEVIIFDPALEAFNNSSRLSKYLVMSNGSQLQYLEIASTGQLFIRLDSFGLITEQ